jgi:hypothetical protein
MDAEVAAEVADLPDASFEGAGDVETGVEAPASDAFDGGLSDPAMEAPAPVEVAAEEVALQTAGEADALEPVGAVAEAALAAEPDPDAALPEAMAEMVETLVEARQVDPLPEAAAEASADDQPAPVAAKGNGRTKRVSSRVVRIHAPEDEAVEAAAAETKGESEAPSPTEQDAEFNRLLQQADDELSDAENRRRLDAIAHLKAAVAATEAERSIEGKTLSDDKSGTYREDLAQVVIPDEVAEAPSEPEPEPGVRPRRKSVSVRPQEPRPGTIRPGMVSPPPLVLISEQRVDRFMVDEPELDEPAPVAAPAAEAPAPEPTPAAPGAMAYIQPTHDSQPMAALRTGRLTGAIGVGAASAAPLASTQKIVLDKPGQSAIGEAEEEADFDEELSEVEQAGLVDFAERLGVTSMAEMLEAAAAYATCIEKRSQFTRPQLMRRLMASAGTRKVSREDGLRSFGTLLRTGRIEKVSRGFYVLAETSPYLAEARRLS